MTKKRICLLTQFFPPETSAAANRLSAMAEALADQYELTVVTNNPGYPHPELYDMSSVAEFDRISRYRIRRMTAFLPHAGSLIIRGLRESFMAGRMTLAALMIGADIIMVSTPSMFLGPAGLLLSGIKRAWFIWDVRDITWRYPKEAVSAAWPVRLITAGIERLMEFCIRRADLVAAATPGIRDVLLERGLSEDKAVTVLNGISREFLEAAKDMPLNLPKERYRILYAGVLGYAQGLCSVLEAAQMLQDKNVEFIFAGDGPDRTAMEKRVREKGLKNVLFTGYLKKADLLDQYRQSDILLSCLKDSEVLNRTGLPSKLFEYMAAGRPILYAGRGLAPEYLKHVGCAVSVPPDDPAALAKAVAGLISSPDRMRKLARRGREHVRENCLRDAILSDLLNTLDKRFAS